MFTYPIFMGGSIQPPAEGLISQLDGSIAGSFYTDIAKTTTAGEGDTVAVWEDQSGGGNDWTQPSVITTHLPTHELSLGALNCYGTGSTGTHDHLIGPDFSSFPALTMMARLKVLGGTRGGVWGVTATSASTTSAHWNYDSNGKKTIFFGTTPGGQGNADYNWGTNGLPADTDEMTFEEQCASDGTVTTRANGVQMFSSDMGDPNFRSTPIIGGTIRFNSYQYHANTRFFKVLVYNKILSAAELAQARAWLES